FWALAGTAMARVATETAAISVVFSIIRLSFEYGPASGKSVLPENVFHLGMERPHVHTRLAEPRLGPVDTREAFRRERTCRLGCRLAGVEIALAMQGNVVAGIERSAHAFRPGSLECLHGEAIGYKNAVVADVATDQIADSRRN